MSDGTIICDLKKMVNMTHSLNIYTRIFSYIVNMSLLIDFKKDRGM